jgi:hypothetical protein
VLVGFEDFSVGSSLVRMNEKVTSGLVYFKGSVIITKKKTRYTYISSTSLF